MCIARKAISSLSDQPVCASHSAVGCLVTANQSDCRRPWPTTRNANRHSKLMMGTTQRSIAVMASVWLRRTVRQPCDGGARHLTMYLDTVEFGDPEAKLEQFTVDARGALQWVQLAYSPDQCLQRTFDLPPSRPTPRFPAPIYPEPCPQPSQDRVLLSHARHPIRLGHSQVINTNKARSLVRSRR